MRRNSSSAGARVASLVVLCLCITQLTNHAVAKHRKSSDEGKRREQEGPQPRDEPSGDQGAEEPEECVPLDVEALKDYPYCQLYERVCAHQDTLVTHDFRYSFANPKRELVPELPYVDIWNFPAALEANTDALRGRQPKYHLQFRAASAHEPTPALRHPSFSNCTLPVVLAPEFPFNMGEFFARAVSAVHDLELDPRVTLVMLTPQSLGLAPFHSLLLQPYSKYPLITSAALGARGCPLDMGPDPGGGGGGSGSDPARQRQRRVDHEEEDDSKWSGEGDGGEEEEEAVPAERPVAWSPDASQPHCFKRLLYCKWGIEARVAAPLAEVAARVVGAMQAAAQLPVPRLAYTGQEGEEGEEEGQEQGQQAAVSDAAPNDPDHDPRDPAQLRVLIESRHGPVRNIKNLQDLLDACKEANERGFSAGGFRGVSCAATSFADAATGRVSRARFLSNVAAVRTAHVLVVVHGAGATNSWWLRQGSSALVELRPCLFGTKYASWPDKYLPPQHQKSRDRIRFFALNVEDPDQCENGDIEAGLFNKTLAKGSLTWDQSFFARDKHLRLRPGPFLGFLRHVAALLAPGDTEAYVAAREADRLHGYLLPGGGLVLGKLGVKNATVWAEEEEVEVQTFNDWGGPRY
ncbi:hypothetical protein HYH02_015084 [Chlamydomonas schloesseri]|uniref:Exostosin GT47 domain-containing protein n=1 Tax=Chlamydomonas schloesseri TaxID=2026947 RepID=A0A835SD16_9CHLO|nr:hypothetical protein HYH02_015084 [Chlamydomonas schloesseri]|eukprot:KAG2425033.1 hypothetical protein HYH02_015084 [Chlamydomonas schloesseri]